MTEITLSSLEITAKSYAESHRELEEIVSDLNDKINKLKREALPRIKKAVVNTNAWLIVLREKIVDAPELFVKPRTFVFHGVKVGYEKGKDKVDYEDADKVIALIEKHFLDQAEILINVKKTPNKTALKELSVADLKRIGCTLEEPGDLIVIKLVDSEVDKIVNALLKEAAESEAV